MACAQRHPGAVVSQDQPPAAAAGEGAAAAPAQDTASALDLAPAPETASAPALTPLQRFKLQPSRFSLDQAVAVTAPGREATSVNFRTTTRLGAPSAEALPAKGADQALVTPTFGLIGPGGVLPRHYTAWADAEARRNSTAMHGLFDLLSRRFTGLFVMAGAKYKPTRNPRHVEQVLSAAIGLGTPHLGASLATPLQALLFHAGGLAARSRSAERLRGMLSEEIGGEVRIVEFTGGWVRLPAAEQTRLGGAGQPGQHLRLGVDAVIGSQIWDASARFMVNLGPLSLPAFRALLPGAPLHTRLVELIRLQVGLEEDFAFNPVLAADQVPPMRLGAPGPGGTGAAQLGWTSWLNAPRPRRRPAAEAALRPQAGSPMAK